MRIMKTFLIGVAVLALMPAAGRAQGRPVHVNLGGGPTFIGGDLGDHFKTGWGPAIGVTVDAPGRKFAFQFEYAYRWFAINDSLDANAGVFDANHQLHQLDFNLIANLSHPDSAVRAYIVAGPGAYDRKVEITKYEGTGVVCDPYWYVCGTYPVSSVVGSRGGWDYGFNFGGGVGFKIGESSEVYIESRYHYVHGPEIGPTAKPTGTGSQTSGAVNGHYFPLTVGFRF